ncbi:MULTISPECIES: LacI family DNA-binding transcriptional regulator [Niallia]|uniref:LacI family DNA-binding transcriptional regulator n=1 Tax=Niallia circulans TaxID=1397 RepID=A0A941GLQ2_NIACI|nr:LacI family DNA-binding transcriptional regulator [Niallia circulans]MCB5237356.1 LacI family DNA-binding transcriptional regulator [Niallia circulans]
MDKKITMQDIADRLNISKNSVSQALSGKPGVSEETRRLVKDVADQLGYSYFNNRKQQQIAKEIPKNIALIASDYAFSLKSFFGEIYLSIEKELRTREMSLFIESIDRESIDQLILPSVLNNHEIDGILILSHLSTEYISKVIDTGIPTVLIDHHSPHLQADCILTNNRFGAFIAVEHLIQLGHSNIAFVGDIDISPSYQERMEGYLLALKKYNIVPSKEWMFTSAKENQEELRVLIDSLDAQPSAWFCVNDGHGFLITALLQQKEIRVPEQASVCSFDNGQLSQMSTPQITTMDIDLNYFGKKAVEQLCWRIENKEEPFQEILLPTNLLIRESTSKFMG